MYAAGESARNKKKECPYLASPLYITVTRRNGAPTFHAHRVSQDIHYASVQTNVLSWRLKFSAVLALTHPFPKNLYSKQGSVTSPWDVPYNSFSTFAQTSPIQRPWCNKDGHKIQEKDDIGLVPIDTFVTKQEEARRNERDGYTRRHTRTRIPHTQAHSGGKNCMNYVQCPRLPTCEVGGHS